MYNFRTTLSGQPSSSPMTHPPSIVTPSLSHFLPLNVIYPIYPPMMYNLRTILSGQPTSSHMTHPPSIVTPSLSHFLPLNVIYPIYPPMMYNFRTTLSGQPSSRGSGLVRVGVAPVGVAPPPATTITIRMVLGSFLVLTVTTMRVRVTMMVVWY